MTYEELMSELSASERLVLQLGCVTNHPTTSEVFAHRTNLDEPTVRRIMGDFVKRGWAEMVTLRTGTSLRGRGYALTLQGYYARAALRNGPPPPARQRFDITGSLIYVIGLITGSAGMAIWLS